MKCIYCESELPANAKFCPKCLNQVICLECGETLLKETPICIFCGTSLKKKNNSSNYTAINSIEFTENENGKSFKASFTDVVGGNFVETFSRIFPLNNNLSKKYLQVSQSEDKIVDVTDVDLLEHTQNLNTNSTSSDVPTDLNNLEKIFKNKNGEISIFDTRIKALNRKDFVARITLLFLYYKKLSGVNEVERVELNAVLNSEKLYDAGFRSWLSSNRKLIDNKKTYLELRPEGVELAEKYLSDFLDSSITNSWDLKSDKKNCSTKNDLKDDSTGISNKSKTSKTMRSYQIIPSLNLRPSGKKSLEEFYAEHPVKSYYEYNLLLVYYLEKVLNEKSININHLYTCYKVLNIKVPNIYQSIADTKKRKGWIDFSNMNDLKVSTVGENYLEHDLKK